MSRLPIVATYLALLVTLQIHSMVISHLMKTSKSATTFATAIEHLGSRCQKSPVLQRLPRALRKGPYAYRQCLRRLELIFTLVCRSTHNNECSCFNNGGVL